mmetsp:Transcript_21531/g.41065  ORF Transcript_21531/g.41065 Transcript_21531/m.41065 type:complete len:183 (-) Transcript_21531:176-724(-)|eukprot:CAMPEP_0114254016 /NCGR_PEP_ID=MMETSP0058-20121206/16736_1 /TAXON_ID=36894 /ORGANISM="Pyramimonas parkeae, CCMP726" /LENGTH=182 /DNA_ID=CAMNT_0001368171 /DNA_START=314 /DNA_END=862 /DNA_ORIENTATION=+
MAILEQLNHIRMEEATTKVFEPPGGTSSETSKPSTTNVGEVGNDVPRSFASSDTGTEEANQQGNNVEASLVSPTGRRQRSAAKNYKTISHWAKEADDALAPNPKKPRASANAGALPKVASRGQHKVGRPRSIKTEDAITLAKRERRMKVMRQLGLMAPIGSPYIWQPGDKTFVLSEMRARFC